MKKKSLTTIILFVSCLIFFLAFHYVPGDTAVKAQDFQSILINEICAKNTTVDAGGGNYYDWVELYNPGTEDCDLSGYGLTDDAEKPYQYTFTSGTVIPAQGYLVIYCDKKAAQGNPAIAGFGLKNEGGVVVLSAPEDGTAVDSVTYAGLDADISFGRLDTAPDQLLKFDVMSPMGPNTADMVRVGDPVFSSAPGFYDGSFPLSIFCDEGCKIYYPTDGNTTTE